jgi:hypothetical protein
MHLPGTCLLISSPERSQMLVSSEPSKAARKLLCPFFTCVFLVMMLDSCIYCCAFVHMMQVCWKSRALWPVHPEGLPWNPRLSCCAATFRSSLFSWQVFCFYCIAELNSSFHSFGAHAMCVTDWWCYLSLVK